MKIAVIGTGYVGLVSGTCFAEIGHEVTCVDKDEGKIATLNKGDCPIYEPGLTDIIKTNLKCGRLAFSSSLSGAVREADIVFIAVGTPQDEKSREADLSFVESAAKEIAQNISGFKAIVTKSTVPVGTGDKIQALIQKETDANVAVASNPEFLREGCAVKDFMAPDRIIVGAEGGKELKLLEDLYKPLTEKGVKLLATNRKSAELIKYASNAFLATKISFINEMATLCEKTGANIHEVSKGMGLDQRIGSSFLQTGPGYGGSCFPKDTQALVATAEQNNHSLEIVKATIAANEARKLEMAQKVITSCGGDVKGKKIAVLGLTFKANTDDVRDSPAIDIIAALQNKGAIIAAFDPEGMENAKEVFQNITYGNSAYEALGGAEALVIITEWQEFKSLDFKKIKTLMKSPNIVDLRNILDGNSLKENGFQYTDIGQEK